MEFTDRDGAIEMAIRLFVWAGGRRISYFGSGKIKVGSQNRLILPREDLSLMMEHRAIESFHTGFIEFSDHVILEGRKRIKKNKAIA